MRRGLKVQLCRPCTRELSRASEKEGKEMEDYGKWEKGNQSKEEEISR